MKIVIDETYDYAYNVWTYERGYVYDVEEVPRSGFYHYWHGANLDVIPHSNAHPASAKEIRSLPSGEALHKGEKTVIVSMDSILHHRDDENAMSEAESVSGAPSRRKSRSSARTGKAPSGAKSATGKKTPEAAAEKSGTRKRTAKTASSEAGKKPSTRKTSAGKKLAETPSGEKTSEPKKKAVRKKTASPSAGKTASRKSSSTGKDSESVSSDSKKKTTRRATASNTSSAKAKKKPSAKTKGK